MLLPVFPFPNAESQNSSSAEMDRAIKKASKVIVLHSITAKPEFKRGIRTARQKALYNKKEYNKWIDDAYLLIGKSNLIKGDLQSASGAFRHILKEYPKENTVEEANVMLARTLILKEEYLETDDILSLMSANKKLPRRLIPLVNATYADYYIHKKHLEDAIPKLEIAAKKARDKKSRLRYNYILGQLYQATGQMAKASEKYLKVIKMSPPYEMTFNAKVNLASAYELGNTNADNIRKQLYKLLKDEKNKEYQDQIYFALGNIDFKENSIDKALTNYKLSVSKSVSNPRQKARSYLAIADIKYNNKEYLPAQAYYDSAVNIIDATFPDFDKISTRAKSLNRLAKSLNTVILQDSVQFIAKMSENERNMFIDRIIAKVKEKEEADKRKQQQELAEQQNNLMNVNEMNSRGGIGQNTEGGKWYFYSPMTKGSGETEFQMKWGKRKLEDNWRRSIKGISGSETANNEENDQDTKENTKKKGMSNKTREYYMQDIPLNDSLMAISQNKIRKGLYDAGTIYKDELSEYKLSANQYEDIIKRYPTDQIAANAAYQLYILYRQLENAAKAEEYKNMLLTKFPESVYAKLLTNPNFIKELQDKEDAVGKLYETAFKDYNNENYSSSLDKSNQLLTNYPTHKLRPKFLYLKALSNGKLTNIDTLRKGLNVLIKEYPKSEESTSAKDIIAFMDIEHPEVKEAEEKIIAKEIYKPVAENEKQFYAMVADPKKGGNQNQLVFNLINFNLDNFSNINLTVKAENFGAAYQIIIVKEFSNKAEALNYFDRATKDAGIMKDITSGVLYSFLINESNLAVLKKEANASTYFKFFNANYNR
jgi:TolA-binding protein